MDASAIVATHIAHALPIPLDLPVTSARFAEIFMGPLVNQDQYLIIRGLGRLGYNAQCEGIPWQ